MSERALKVVARHALYVFNTHNLTIAATFSSLIAWNDGVLWQSHLGVDGLTVTNVSPNRIEGYGYDPALGADDPFVVDSSTGAELHS